MTETTENITAEKKAVFPQEKMENSGPVPENQTQVNTESYQLNNLTPFAESIIQVSGEKLNNCYQCGKCTAGCPITYAMDILPHHIIKMVQLGMEEKVLTSKTIWLCAACETCGTRCPNEIMLSPIMDALRQRALNSKYKNKIGEKATAVFHREFLSSIKSHGRVYELMMMAMSIMKSGNLINFILKFEWVSYLKLLFAVLPKGKMSLFPHNIKKKKEFKNIFKKLNNAQKV
ncbi:MAG: 4Fe-4S dicluster domain-containing protein [Spirochaetes bacterium]|nr:4Fe-4S dicluster domain-containing protein [Spirochaetota bacterium]